MKVKRFTIPALITAIAISAMPMSAQSHDYRLNVQDFNKLNVVDNIESPQT